MPTPTTTWRATTTSTRDGISIIPQVLPNEMMKTVVRTKKELSRLPAIVHGRDITAMNKKVNDRLLEEYKSKYNISKEEDGIVPHTTKVHNRGRCTNPYDDKRTITYKRRMLEEDGSAARRNESRNNMPTPTTSTTSARDGNIPEVLQASNNNNITTGKQKYITVFTCDICKGERV